MIEALANQAIAQLGKIIPRLTPAQLAKMVAAYEQGVAVLHPQGWLTAAQASTLDRRDGANRLVTDHAQHGREAGDGPVDARDQRNPHLRHDAEAARAFVLKDAAAQPSPGC